MARKNSSDLIDKDLAIERKVWKLAILEIQLEPSFLLLLCCPNPKKLFFVLHVSQLKIDEIPIIFVERIAGHSTVTWKEILTSLRGILYLLLLKKKIRMNV